MVKITVDTKEDSHEEIKKIITMLNALVEGNSYSNQGNIFDDTPSETPPPSSGGIFGNVFDNATPVTKEPEEETDLETTATPSTDDEEKDDIPPVMEY